MSIVKDKLVVWLRGLGQRATCGSGLSTAEAELLGASVRPESIVFSVRTESRVDVGSWFSKKRVWAGVSDRDLLLLAAGGRPYVESISLQSLQKSLYNHVTGEVVLGPAEGLSVKQLRMSPLDARRFLACIPGEDACKLKFVE